jgi:5-methylcytosine-specific restriction protein B
VTAGEGNNPQDLTVEEAVVIARKHCDQLIRGVEHLRQLPQNGTDDDYKRLQERLDQDAPDVSDLAWGHKYFSLMCPDKMDDLHQQELQRFHLLKLLQTPPEGKGRYVCAGRYVGAATELAIPMVNLTAVLHSVNGRRHRYWRVGTSDGTAPRNRWSLMKGGNCVAIGWNKLGNLSTLEATKESRELLQKLLAEKHPATPSVTGRSRTQVFNFVTTFAEGDIVLAADGGTILGVGRITGDYAYDGDSDFPHRRPVQWLSLDEWKMPDPEGLRTTVHEIKQGSNILECERKIQGISGQIQQVGQVSKPYQQAVTGPPQKQPPRLAGIPGRI